MIAYLLQGISWGLVAAAQPGPFQAYLLSQTMQHGWRRTLPAAFAPLVSDGLIILLVLFVLTRFSEVALGWVQMAGGVFILYLAWGAARAFWRPSEISAVDVPRHGIFRASLMNFLNPNPYIFWGTVGGPIFLAGWRVSPSWGLAFGVGMYVTLIAGFMLFIWLFGKMGSLSVGANRVLSGVSAVALVVFGVWQLWQGGLVVGG